MIDSTLSETENSREDSTRQLYVEFEIRPGESSPCPLRRFDDDVSDVRQQRAGETCHTDITLAPEDCGCSDDNCTEIVHRSSDVDDACPCTVFGDHGCVPQITEISDDVFLIETYLPDRNLLTTLVSDLKSVVDELSLRRLKRVGTVDRNQRDSVSLDLFELTEKQRDAAAAAVAAGYYSNPREVTLGELAEELDVTKSALSQRLSAVESKLATAAFARLSAEN